ncbi:putative Histidine kinase [Desulfamplus magnetovallimortis]|uniref:histidine kinase n=1 Tax=Desulfamplus magnetovallimortis TaxID=1246637 RepID=A0A1W1HBF7_9BACT|nr:response regulator [Desulfamplus magnetovallimortis]SLM29725.1 putative Histidine kinase [Desulfamplus magnetovallimortis]
MVVSSDFEDLFANENPEHLQHDTTHSNDNEKKPDIWKILVVDDEADIHMVTRLALSNFEFENHTIEILSAYSEAEAKEILHQHPDIAMVFMDVVMESHDSGFQLVNYIRDDLDNQNIRIVIRTGQPGNAKEQELFRRYRIDDYKIKTELTSERLLSTAVSCLKTYDMLIKKEFSQNKLEQTLEEQNALLQNVNARLIDEIRKRETTEQKLKNSEKKFRMLYENLDVTLKSITDGVISTDRHDRIILMNKMAETLTGWEVKDALNRDLYKVFNITRKPGSSLAKAEMESEDQILLTSREGTQKIIEFSSSPIKNDTGEASGNAIIFRDITEKIQMGGQLARAQRMESLGLLAGGIAHDFNNILASILGFTELLMFDAPKGSRMEEYLTEIFTAGKRAKELVKQILAFARQTGDTLQPVQIHLIAKETLKLIRSSIPTTIAIQSNIKSSGLAMANPTQIHQIFMNLFTNAAHAMDEHGGVLTVTMMDENIAPGTKGAPIKLKPGQYIKITVEDTGTGIPPEIIHSIFEPYFTTKQIGEGTGMGLALVHGIIENYKGSITVESEMGKGTVFTVYIPATTFDSKQNTELSEKKTYSGSGRVLFVDDEAAIVKVGKLLLEKNGYHVSSTTSSLDALEMFTKKPDAFDLIITDMTMPHMTGDVLAEKIMKIRPELPIILCTGYNKRLSKEQAFKIGFKEYIKKPFDKDILLKTVKSVLNSKNK